MPRFERPASACGRSFPRTALSTLLVLLSLLVMVLPSFPQELWGAGVGAPVSSRGHDGLVSQGEVPSTGSAARLEVDDAMTPPSLSGSRVLGAASATDVAWSFGLVSRDQRGRTTPPPSPGSPPESLAAAF